MALKIFISSTMDLQKERDAVTEVINQIRAIPIKMELFTARSQTSKEVCLEEVTNSNIYIGVFGEKYGFVPSTANPKNLSVTAMEFEKAEEQGIPTLIFIKNAEKRDSSLSDFLARISDFNNGVFRKTFGDIQDLKYWVLASFVNYLLHTAEHEDRKGELRLLLPNETCYKDYLERICEYADFKGIHQLRRVVQIKLRDIYVPLNLLRVTNLSDTSLELPNTNNSKLRSSLAGSPRGLFNQQNKLESIMQASDKKTSLEAYSLEKILLPNKKVVILGGPGSGKTTMIRYLTAKLITDKDSTIFPVFVSLREYIKLKSNETTSILDFISNYFNSHDLEISSGFFAKYLSAGSCVVMFDGLDEILNDQDRIEAATKIEQFAASFGEGNTIIVTSRIPSYRLAQLTGFEHYTLEQFQEEQISDFVKKWFQIVEENTDCQTGGHELISMLCKDPNLLSLSTNPLMLSLICLISFQGVPLPKRKGDLYDICIRTLYSSWETKKGFNSLLSDPQRFEVIKKLAFLFLDKKIISCTEYEVISLLDKILEEQQVPKNDVDHISSTIFKEITERSCFLVEREPNTFAFIHLGIRDYLASLYLAGMDSVKGIFSEYLHKKIHSYDYEQTICLCAGCLAQQSLSRASAFLSEILESGTQYEEMAHCDLILSLKCLFSSGITQGSHAVLLFDKMKKIFEKGNISESSLLASTLVDADIEIIEKTFKELISKMNSEIVIDILMALVFSRNIPENSELIDCILGYLEDHLMDRRFDFEIPFLTLQLARNGSKKAANFSFKVIENSAKYEIAYPMGALTILGLHRSDDFKERVLKSNFISGAENLYSILWLSLLSRVEPSLGKIIASRIIQDKGSEKSIVKKIARECLEAKEETKEEAEQRIRESYQKKFDQILTDKDGGQNIEDYDISNLAHFIPENKIINSIDELRRVFALSRLSAYKLCQLYALAQKQYPSLSKEITRLILTLKNDNAIDSQTLLSYIDIETHALNKKEQKDTLIKVIENQKELSIIRQVAVQKLGQEELNTDDFERLFLLVTDKDVQASIFMVLLRQPNFDQSKVLKAVSDEINRGNPNLHRILNAGVHLSYNS
jgi:hypothetical protein